MSAGTNLQVERAIDTILFCTANGEMVSGLLFALSRQVDTRGYVQDVCEMGSHYFDLDSKDVIAELFLWVYEIKWMMVMGANDNK